MSSEQDADVNAPEGPVFDSTSCVIEGDAFRVYLYGPSGNLPPDTAIRRAEDGSIDAEGEFGYVRVEERTDESR